MNIITGPNFDRLLQDLDLVGLHEIADRLGVAPNTPNQWRQRHRDTTTLHPFPKPDLELAMGPLWIWARVERWAIDTGRLEE